MGGFLSGSLHALTGPDHMAILLPLIFNKHWYNSCIYGIVWGCGHGVTSTVIGMASFVMKSFVVNVNDFLGEYRFLMELMDCVVGFTLVVIGVMGIMEQGADGEECGEHNDASTAKVEGGVPIIRSASGNVIDWKIYDSSQHGDETSKSPLLPITTQSTTAPTTATPNTTSSTSVVAYLALFVNGALLGVSWDGLPSLAPSIVMDSYPPLILFLMAYLAGTMLMMGIAAGAVGEATHLISQLHRTDRIIHDLSPKEKKPEKQPHISERLAYMSSLASILIGVFWILLSITKFIATRYFLAQESDNFGPQPHNNSNIHHMSSSHFAANDALTDNNDNGGHLVVGEHINTGGSDSNYLVHLLHRVAKHYGSHHDHALPHGMDEHAHLHSHIKLFAGGLSVVVILAVIFHTIGKEYGLFGTSGGGSGSGESPNSLWNRVRSVWGRLQLAVKLVPIPGIQGRKDLAYTV